jgi:hypothetical protein
VSTRPARWLPAVGAIACAACVAVPTAEEYRAGTVAPVTARYGAVTDGRARFREVFCALLPDEAVTPAGPTAAGTAAGTATAMTGEPACDRWLWRLADEPPASALPAPLPVPRPLRAFVITGAFSDCFDEHALAFRAEVRALASRGHRIELLPVGGRSGVEHNAAQIAEHLERHTTPGEHIVLIGYSKGAIDALEYVATRTPDAVPVAAVVSVAGPMLGSPAAAAARSLYSLFEHAFAARCDPGDGQVLASLDPEVRERWFATHTLPADVAYFSLASFTTRDRIARGAKASWRILAAYDRWNDGQVAAATAAIPGGTVLGYVDTDHWGVALDIEVSQPLIGKRRDPRPIPREQLLEAVLLHVGETLWP